jgi:hypothetical protein
MFDLSTVIATASWPAAIDSPRGVSIPIRGAPETNQTPAVVLRVALDTPARLLDLGLRGFNLTRLGLSVYAQQSVDYGGGGLELRGETTVAVETAARVGYLAASFLPVVGLAATIPHSSPEQLRLSLTVRNGATLPGLVVGLGKNESPW